MATATTVPAPMSSLRGLALWMSRPWWVAVGIGLLAAISAYAIHSALNGAVTATTTWVIAASLSALTFALGGVIAWQIMRLWSERRSRIAGSRLHLRLVLMFS